MKRRGESELSSKDNLGKKPSLIRYSSASATGMALVGYK
jgi:hypothetical protein